MGKRSRQIGAIGAALALTLLFAGSAAGFAGYAVSTTPNSHEFGSQTIGTAGAPFTFTIRVHCDEDVANPGTCLNPHPFTPNVTVSGDFAIQSNTCTGTLPGTDIFGTTCTFAVVFHPAAAGPRTGVVDVGEPFGFGKASVTGTGVAASPAAGIQPGTQPGGQPATKSRKCKKHRSVSAAKKKCKKKRPAR